MTATRRLDWISSTDPKNIPALYPLQKRMTEFYAQSAHYYADIDFTASAWRSDPTYLDIARRITHAHSILEVGCGSANILRMYPDLGPKYHGCDFSTELLARNGRNFPDADFRPISDPAQFPFPDNSFDAIFSVFVLEHVVFPAKFLDECLRILHKGGHFILRCPDFLGSGSMPSQRAGFSYGTGRSKLRSFKLFDAFVTGLDRKVTIPRRCAVLRRQIGANWGFWINREPVCFCDPFSADHDAVYLTYEAEIVHYLGDRIRFDPVDTGLSATQPIYLTGTKL